LCSTFIATPSSATDLRFLCTARPFTSSSSMSSTATAACVARAFCAASSSGVLS
jgi:hypothetical protein